MSKPDKHESNLKWGTQKHNIADAIRDKTFRKPPRFVGVDQHNAKLNPAKVREIREIYKDRGRISQESLAKKFGISRSTLRDVLKRRTWKHV